MEGVGRAVGADVPAFGEVRRQVQLRVERDQSAEDALVARAIGCVRDRIAADLWISPPSQDQSLIQRNIIVRSFHEA
ncbi:MAG: hypothetical protein MZV64_19730 [Ignavibacteriales bacterium]|nr:hypothetical protein [Ignavibacteriales bacterium]